MVDLYKERPDATAVKKMQCILAGQKRGVTNWTKNPIDFPYKTLASGSTLFFFFFLTWRKLLFYIKE